MRRDNYKPRVPAESTRGLRYDMIIVARPARAIWCNMPRNTLAGDMSRRGVSTLYAITTRYNFDREPEAI